MKKLLLLSTLLLLCFSINAQNTSYSSHMQYVFGNIDKTKVTIGYLKDFGIRFSNIEACNGTIATDNFVNKDDWHALYSSLYSMRVGTTIEYLGQIETHNISIN